MQTVKPVYRIGAAGLDPRDWRLIEIVFKHSQYNRFEFVLAPGADPESIDILIANTNDAEGVRAVSAVRTGTRSIPVIAAVPRGAPGAARHAISIDRLTLQLLPILNRVVELELQRQETVQVPTPAPATVLATVVAADKIATVDTVAAADQALAADKFDVVVDNELAADKVAAADIFDALVSAAQVVPTVSAEPPAKAPAPLATELESAAELARPDAATAAEPLKTAPPIRSSPRPPPLPKLDLPVLPVLPAPTSNLLPFPKSHLSPPAPQQLRVLVVDDSPTVRQQLTGAVQRMGLACEVVSSGAEALKSLAEHYFDLILLDVVMPDMDGYKLTRLIKRNRQFRQIPIILLTSRSSAFDLARGALAGCDTYLIKPVTLQALETAVFKQLRKSLAIDDLSAMLRPPLPEPELLGPKPTGPTAGKVATNLSDDQSLARR